MSTAKGTWQSRYALHERKAHMNKDSTKRVFEGVDESFRRFGVLLLQLPLARHS